MIVTDSHAADGAPEAAGPGLHVPRVVLDGMVGCELDATRLCAGGSSSRPAVTSMMEVIVPSRSQLTATMASW